MANAYRNSTNQEIDTNGSTTVALAYDSAVLSGSLLIAAVYWEANGTITTSSVGDSVNGAASWTRAGAGVQNANADQVEIWYKANSSAGTPTVTATFSASANFRALQLDEVTGADTVTPLDKYAAAVGTSVSPNSGSQTTTTDGQYIFGAIYHTGRTITNLNGFTSREVNTGGREIVDLIQSVAGPQSVSVTISASDVWTAVMATFKAAGAAAASPFNGSVDGAVPTGKRSPADLRTFARQSIQTQNAEILWAQSLM